MPWSVVSFGRHRGKTLPQIVFHDPDWFFWAYEQGVFKADLQEQAEELYQKATHIRVPPRGSEKHVAEYVIHPSAGKLVGVELVPVSRPRHEGSPTFRKDVLDMKFPKTIHGYDKTGGKILIKDLKSILFGSPSRRLMRESIEAFFDYPANFDL